MASTKNFTFACANDNSFGPTVLSNCRGGFDFTALFEHVFLITVPCLLMLLAFPLRLSYLSKQGKKTRTSIIRYSKLLFACIFSGLQLVLVILWAIEPGVIRTMSALAAANFSFLNSLALLVLSTIEHQRSVRPSFIINVYLLFSLVFDIAVARTMWLGITAPRITYFFTASIALKAGMLILESREKRKQLTENFAQLPPEGIAGVINRSVFWWLNSLFIKGFRGIIHTGDLYQLDTELSANSSSLRAKALQDDLQDGQHHGLFIATAKNLAWPIMRVILPRLCLIGFTYAQPALIDQITSFAGQSAQDRTMNHGYGLIGATFLVYCGIAISKVHANHAFNRVLLMIRGTLTTSIYEKMLRLPDGVLKEGSALTLMSTDIDRICIVLDQINDLWAGIIEVAIALFLLEQQVGYAAAAPLGLGIVACLVAVLISSKSPVYQQAWFKAIEKRVAVTSNMLTSIKGFKMMGLTTITSKIIHDLRSQEIRLSKGFRRFNVALNVLVNSQLAFFPVLVFGIFAATNISHLTVSKAFTTLSVVSLLSGPLIEILANIYLLASAAACFHRIQEFLLLPDLEESRSLMASEPLSERILPTQILQCFANIHNSNVGVDGCMAPILSRISVTIPAGLFTMIVGPSGCGKSTLLRGLLGESQISEGRFEVSTRQTAYCNDDPWLVNDTVTANILSGSCLEPIWFASVLEACAFDADLYSLIEDQVMIGTAGAGLSGGQRQRIALARAIYSKQKVLILDNPLSGLDALTEAKVVKSVFGGRGLLKTVGGYTVVLATNMANYLNLADHVVYINKDRHICYQGTFNEFERRGLVEEIGSYSQRDPSKQKVSEPMTPANNTKRLAPRQQTQSTADDVSRRTGDISVYKYYLGSLGYLQASLFAIFTILRIFFIQYPQIWLQRWAEANENAPGVNTKMYFGVYAAFGAAAIVFVGAAIWQTFIVLVPRSASRLHSYLLSSVLAATYHFHVATDTGTTLNRFSQDMSLIDSQLPSAFLQTSTAFAAAIGGGILIAAGSKFMAVTIPFCILILYILQKFYLRLSRQIRLMDIEAKSPLFTHFTDTSNGIRTIRAFGWQERQVQRCLELLNVSQRPVYLLLCIQRWLALALDLMIMALAVVLVSLAVAISGSVSSGSIGVALINILGFNQILAQAITSYTTMETSLGAVVRTKNFIATTKPESDPAVPRMPSLDWPSQGNIKFQDVSATYFETNPPLLRNINISIAAGEKVAICGRSGSGKSSIILLIARLLDCSSGSIIIDNIPTNEIPRERCRTGITILPQFPVTFPGTVRFNADPSSTKSDEEIMEALQTAGLGEVFSREDLDASLEKFVLSKGQKQLFAIASASLRENRIVVLDEATSDVDNKGEQIVNNIIFRTWRSKTVIAVIHHLSTITNYDKVAVIDAGQVVEYGDPQQLLSQRDSWVKRLWDA